MARSPRIWLIGTASTGGGTIGSGSIILSGTVSYIYISYQYSYPDADITDGDWLNELDSTTDLYASIDESTVNDDDYIYTESFSSCTISLGTLSDPETSDYHTLKFRAKGNGVDTLRVSLLENTTTRATRDYDNLSPILTTYQFTLSGAETDSITDYTNLSIKFETL